MRRRATPPAAGLDVEQQYGVYREEQESAEHRRDIAHHQATFNLSRERSDFTSS